MSRTRFARFIVLVVLALFALAPFAPKMAHGPSALIAADPNSPIDIPWGG